MLDFNQHSDIQHTPETQVRANGIDITYDAFGDAKHPAMVLIMGLGTQMIYWDEQLCRLLASKGFYVLRFDNRDIGKSTWLNHYTPPNVWQFLANSFFSKSVQAPYVLTDMANDTLALMDALHIEKAHIVGASMGGMIAQCIALKCPERVLSLTSIMSTTGDRSLPKPHAKVSAKLLRPIAKQQDAFLQQSLSVWNVLHGDNFEFDKQRVEALLKRSWERGFNPAGVARQLAAIIDSPDRTQALQHLKVPTLVIHGEADALVPVECGMATADAIDNAKLVIYPGMGHTLPSQLWPEIVNEIVMLSQQGI